MCEMFNLEHILHQQVKDNVELYYLSLDSAKTLLFHECKCHGKPFRRNDARDRNNEEE